MRRIKVRVFRRNPARSKHRKRSRSRSRVRAKKHSMWGSVAAHKRRVNPKRRRAVAKRAVKRRSVKRRRNPSFAVGKVFSGSMVKTVLGMGSGYLLGRQIITLLTTGSVMGRAVFTPPAFLTTTLKPVVGVANIVIGSMVTKKGRGGFAKDLGMGIVVAGGVDIITGVVNMAAPGTLGMWVNDPLSSFRNPSLGMQVTRGGNNVSMGRVGPSYRVPKNLQVAGYSESAFSDVDSSFPAG